MKATEYLATKRVNLELILYINTQGILHYGLRLRPWKQEGRRPMMILVQGLTLDDCMNNAARAYHLDKWLELDWTARPWHLVQPNEVDAETQIELEFMDTPYDGPGNIVSDSQTAFPPALLKVVPELSRKAR